MLKSLQLAGVRYCMRYCVRYYSRRMMYRGMVVWIDSGELQAQKISRVMAVVCFMLLSGCASEPFIPTAEESLDSSTYAIYQNIRLQAVVNECKVFRGSVKKTIEMAQESWWERNWPLVYAADQEFLSHTAQRQAKYGEDEGLLYALKYVMESKERAAEEAKRVPRARPNEKEMCQRLADEYTNGDMDLHTNTKHYPVIQYLAEKYPVKQLVPYAVPNIKTTYRAQPKVGKSYYKAESLAAKTWCSRVKILNIKDLWPEEMYGAYCDNGATHLIVCKWGNCTPQSR